MTRTTLTDLVGTMSLVPTSNLISSHPGNTNAVTHGLWSPRTLAPRAREIANALASLPHIQPLDALAAEEAGSLIARLEAIDFDLEERGQLGRHGARSLLDHKARLGRELRAWLVELGATPRARFLFARSLTTGSLADEITRRLAGVQEP